MRGFYAIILVLLSSSCGFKYHDSISGNGKVGTLAITNDTITHLTISDKIDVILIPSDSIFLALRADENLLHIIKTSQNGKSIEIYCDKLIRMARAKEVLVYGSSIEHITLGMKSTLKNEDSLYVNNLTVITGAGSEVDLRGNFDTLRMQIGAGNEVNLSGKANQFNIKAIGGSDVYAYGLRAKEGVIISDGASDVQATLIDRAYLYASNFADIRYRGNPQIIESRTSGLADIKKAR